MLSDYHQMKRDFRGYSPVQYSIILNFLVRSDPKPSHLLSVFQHSPEPRRQDTGVCHCSSLGADIGNMSIQASLKRFKSNDNLPIRLTISTCPLLVRVN